MLLQGYVQAEKCRFVPLEAPSCSSFITTQTVDVFSLSAGSSPVGSEPVERPVPTLLIQADG